MLTQIYVAIFRRWTTVEFAESNSTKDKFLRKYILIHQVDIAFLINMQTINPRVTTFNDKTLNVKAH